MKRFARRPLHLVLFLLLCLVVASACSGAGRTDPATKTTSSAIVQGQVDTAGNFRYIARVDPGGGVCSGTLISPSVVLTAAHCLENYAQGCGTFTYRQPDTYDFNPDPPCTGTCANPALATGPPWRTVVGLIAGAGQGWRVEFAQQGQTLQDDRHDSLPIPVDAIRVHPRGYQVNLYQCSGNCGGGEDYVGLFTPFDVALLHLAVPLNDQRLGADMIQPAKYIAAFGEDDPLENRYYFDPFSAMKSNHTRVLVGGTSENSPPAAREIAYATFTRFTASLPNGRTTCDPEKLTPWSVEKSVLNVSPLHSGDGCPNSGDSGGPIILNASGVAETSSASDIPGLPDGQPLVAGDYNSGGPGLGATTCDSSESVYAASWDAVESPTAGAPVTGLTQTGTFLNASTNDWDQDLVDDADDKCPIAWNPDQSDCNAVAELALGYPERGWGCSPTWRGALAPGRCAPGVPQAHARPAVASRTLRPAGLRVRERSRRRVTSRDA